jgi:hypothetical protein
MTPTEANGRRLVEVLAKYFPLGCTCGDLRKKYQKVAHRKSGTFFNALKLARAEGWIVSDGGPLRSTLQIYSLNPNGCWRKPEISIEEKLETARRENSRLEFLLDTQVEQTEQLQDQIESFHDRSEGNDGVAISNLVRIISDNSATPRQRLKAAAVILGYKVQNADVTEFAKRYLETLCASDVSVDYKIQAAETLRRAEGDAQLRPSIERLTPPSPPRDREAEEAERRATSERRRKHLEEQSRLDQEQLRQEWKQQGWTWPSA